jgi:hypothetical protein
MKRREGESFEDYRKRLTEENKALKKYLRDGTLFWNTYRKGAYYKPVGSK